MPEMKKAQVPGPGNWSDQIAQEEEKGINEGDLDRISKENEHKRTEQFLNSTFSGMNRLVVVFIWAILVAFLVVGWHYVMPTAWSWLNENQLDVLRTFILSCSLLGNLAVATFRPGIFRINK